MMQKSSQEYRYLESLFQDCGLVELRAIKRGEVPRWKWFNDPDALIAQARQWSGEGVLLCTTMAQPRPDVTGSLADADVTDHRRLLFDFDRKKGNDTPIDCNASDEELGEAEGLRSQFVGYMDTLGFPAPALATSGNGLHAVYRVRLKPSDESRAVLGRAFQVLSDTFQSERFKLDTTTRNPAQACRLYGALNRKFPATEGRPQRLASIELPSDWTVGGFYPLTTLQRYFPEPEKPALKVIPGGKGVRRGRGDWRELDIVSWFQARGLYIKPLSGGKHAVRCPWEVRGDHEKTCYSDTVIWEESFSGFPSFHCSHDTCANRGALVDLDAVMGGIADFCGGERHG